jgi:hypothetical protein
MKHLAPAAASLAAALIYIAPVSAADAPASGATPAKSAAPAGESKGIRRTRDGHPDFTGFWNLSRKQHPVDAALVAKLPAGAALLDDSGAAEFPPGEFGGLKLKPAAVAAAKAWKPQDDMTVTRACLPPSIVYATQGPFPYQIHQGRDLIVFQYEYFDLVRIIFMDGRAHPPADAPHSKTGHSVGHWEGDELVIDTTHLSAATITNNGLSHTDNVHVVERFKLSADGRTLQSTMWFEDPEVLDNRGARYIQWTLEPGQYVFPYECDPTFGSKYTEAQ